MGIHVLGAALSVGLEVVIGNAVNDAGIERHDLEATEWAVPPGWEVLWHVNGS